MALQSGAVRSGVTSITFVCLGVLGGGCATIAERPDTVAVATLEAAPVIDAGEAQSMRHLWLDRALVGALARLECTSEDAKVLACLGRTLRTRGFANAALATLARVTQLTPGDADAWLDYARAAFTKGLVDDSIAATRAALLLQPDLDEAKILLERSLRRRAARTSI